ncbi:MAG: hypothetical protein HY360_10835 [Verrucomicrobia bacterium]|nr:hypothetical protein [Verrucomicrobiota bacterium]
MGSTSQLKVQQLADKTYRFWQKNPRHPSLVFKKLEGNEIRFSVRIGAHYRAVGRTIEGRVEWVWIGTHEEYNQLVGR